MVEGRAAGVRRRRGDRTRDFDATEHRRARGCPWGSARVAGPSFHISPSFCPSHPCPSATALLPRPALPALPAPSSASSPTRAVAVRRRLDSGLHRRRVDQLALVRLPARVRIRPIHCPVQLVARVAESCALSSLAARDRNALRAPRADRAIRAPASSCRTPRSTIAAHDGGGLVVLYRDGVSLVPLLSAVRRLVVSCGSCCPRTRQSSC